ncbi:putative protein caax prenyl protease 1 related protein [Pyrococcus sp. NA2]|uniref:M48 family metallopeptidase n=1 Tax=Pyrococcus sp. (strain NA2) TaxID=342949 RepID=UPI000209AB0F|nr:M48 family metallopeptidase [Pyrococcus sp. NA2]AEC52632.1 putative protein caax prenyl protease 1 related protein [Pyrococcus sp. NA2]
MMWKVLLVISIIIPPLMVFIEGRRIRRSEKQEMVIRLEKVYIVSIILCAVIFSVSGFLGFFDFVSKFVSPLDMLLLFLPVILSISISTLILVAFLEEERLKKPGTILTLILVFCFIVIVASVFIVIPELFPWKLRLPIYAILFLVVAEGTAVILRRIGKGKPLQNELRETIENLCRRINVEVEEIYVIQDEGLAALVTGAKGKTVFITEGLLENLDKDEILAVIAHELGHIKKKHLLKDYGVVILSIAPLSLLPFILESIHASSFVEIALIIASFAILILGMLYRYMRMTFQHEFEADEFAANLVGAEAMIRALEKISEREKIPRRTPKWFNILHRHPSIEERIDRLKSLLSSPPSHED